MSDEHKLSRVLWAIVLLVTAAFVVTNFARHPLEDGADSASAFGAPMSLWVADSGGPPERIAAQAVACWERSGRTATVGVLPGGPSRSILDFLGRAGRAPDELLLVTSSMLAEIVHEGEDPQMSAEGRELANRAQALLARSTPVAMLARDRLAIAVSARSRLNTVAQLVDSVRANSSASTFDIAADPWLRGNLALLTEMLGLHGEAPYQLYDTQGEALANLAEGRAVVSLVLGSALTSALRSGRVRELPWPLASHEPAAWITLIAPPGLGRHVLGELRARTGVPCGGSTWAALLRRDGLQVAPLRPASDLLRVSLDEASHLEAAARRVMRDYD